MNPETVQEIGWVPRKESLAIPNDSLLPGCELLEQEKLRTEVIARLLENRLEPETELIESKVAVLRHVPGKRCNFRIELKIRLAPGAPIRVRLLVGKIYAQDHGANVHSMLRKFERHGFATGRFRVPEPLAYEPRWKLLVLGWAEGTLLRSLILENLDGARRMDDAANWLLKFHQCGVNTGRRYTLRRHLQTLAGRASALANAHPQRASLIDGVLRRIEDRGTRLSGWAPGPTHRDFSPDHLVFGEGRVTGLDFDEFRQYDPMFDVAHFMAHLRLLGLRHFGDYSRFDHFAQIFRTAYKTGAREFSEERVRFYQAVAYFKLACIVGLVVRPSDWKGPVEVFLRDAERELRHL